jgi:hypothetical protein
VVQPRIGRAGEDLFNLACGVHRLCPGACYAAADEPYGQLHGEHHRAPVDGTTMISSPQSSNATVS